MSGLPRFTVPLSAVPLILMTVLGLILCAFLVVPFLATIAWSVTLAILLAPLDRLLGRRLRSRNFAALTTVAVAACIVVLPAMFVLTTLLNEAIRSLGLISPSVGADAWAQLISIHPRLAPLLQWIHDTLDLSDVLRTMSATLGTWSGSLLRASFSGLATLLLTFYFLFYLLRDRDSIIDSIRLHLPLSQDEFDRVGSRVVDTIFATVFGTAVVAALQGGLGGLMFWWLGLPAPVFWGLLMALLAIVPFLGAFVVWAPAAGLLVLKGEYASAIMLTAWGSVVVGLVDNLVYPLLVGNRLRMHTLLSFIAVVGGLIFLGTPGIVLGPTIVAVTLKLVEIRAERQTMRVATPH